MVVAQYIKEKSTAMPSTSKHEVQYPLVQITFSKENVE